MSSTPASWSKWVIDEPGSEQALKLRDRMVLSAPDLLIAECANIVWKKVRLGETDAEPRPRSPSRLLVRADIELVPRTPSRRGGRWKWR